MTLRPMTMDDADKMLEWKNYPETRQYAIATSLEIKKEDHYKWLAENIGSFRVMVKHGGEVVGAIRIKDCEVSIWVERAWWKHGIATWVLQHHAQDRGLTAKIVDGNIGSMRAFIRAGFFPASYHEGGVLSWTDQHGETRVPSYYNFKKA